MLNIEDEYMKLYDIWFSKIPLDYINKLKLIRTTSNIEEIYMNLIKKRCFISEEQYSKSKELYCEKALYSELDYMKKNNIHIVNYKDEEYPDVLRNYDDSPSVLYYKGDIEVVSRSKNVSIVGARKNSYYGQKLATYISETLAQNSVNVISGVAKGIDSIAHRGALRMDGVTIGVLGCGIDVVYPKENNDLYEEIVRSGVLISEFPCGMQPYPLNFLKRNRIISSLANLVIVVQAGERSGSLNTASHAVNNNINLMAVPGDVYSPLSKGTNKLISEGAYVYTSMSDIFSLIGMNCIDDYATNSITKERFKKIYDILSDVPMHINEIINITNIDISYLYELLFEMQTLNIINCIDGSFYIKAV